MPQSPESKSTMADILRPDETTPDNQPVLEAYNRRTQVMPEMDKYLSPGRRTRYIKKTANTLTVQVIPEDGQAMWINPGHYLRRLELDGDYVNTFCKDGIAGINLKLDEYVQELKAPSDRRPMEQTIQEGNDLLASALALFPHKAHTLAVTIDRTAVFTFRSSDARIKRSKHNFEKYLDLTGQKNERDILVHLFPPFGNRFRGLNPKFLTESADVILRYIDDNEERGRSYPILGIRLFRNRGQLYVPLDVVQSLAFSTKQESPKIEVDQTSRHRGDLSLSESRQFISYYLYYRGFSTPLPHLFPDMLTPRFHDPYLWVASVHGEQILYRHVFAARDIGKTAVPTLYEMTEASLPFTKSQDVFVDKNYADLLSYITEHTEGIVTTLGSDAIIDRLMRLPAFDDTT